MPLHCIGTAQRDLDLIAIPWTEEARDAETVVRHIAGKIKWELGSENRIVLVEGEPEFEARWPAPAAKPHGRIAYTIMVGSYYIDLSVMPRGQDR